MESILEISCENCVQRGTQNDPGCSKDRGDPWDRNQSELQIYSNLEFSKLLNKPYFEER